MTFFATMPEFFGFDHHKITYSSQGLDMCLTNLAKPSKVIKDIAA
jgi:hypothetical protein